MVFSRRLFICRNKTPGTRYLASAFRRQLSERFFSGSAFRNGQFSVFVHNTQIPKPELQELVLGQVERYMKNFSRHLNKESDSTGGSLLFDLMTPPQRADSLVIVVSKELMHWITDSVFIPGLLGHLFKPSQTELQRNEKRQVVTVVVGVADGVGHSSPGISILHGERASIFSGTPQILRKTGQPCDKQSWLSFKLNPLAGATYLVPSLEATVPLANTIFNNEVPSVLVLSKWAIDPNASYCVGQDLILNQTIHPELVDAGCPTVGAVPVQAISPPRKVLSGLGNIVRQIEIDGSATHASEELERNVAKILQNSPESGPLRIWACMIPANLTNSREDQGAPFKEQDLSTLLARRDSGSLEPITPRNLVSEGCNLFQVLSGGGGWGAKKGLLSLDPDTTYGPHDEQSNLEKFSESFTSLRTSGASSGMVTPGKYIQFFTEFCPSKFSPEPGTFIGTAMPNGVRPCCGRKSAVTLSVGYFGTFSAGGLFLRDAPSCTESKISTEGAYIRSTWAVS